MSRAQRVALRGAVVGASVAVAAGAGVLAVATAYARRVVTPDAERPDDVEVLAVGAGTVTLRATPETVAAGRYGLWIDGGAGHARLGEVLDHDEEARVVTRRVLGVDRGRLREGPARWNQYYYAGTPAAVGPALRGHQRAGRARPMPAWLVPPAPGVPARDTWAVLVHGRGATREECLRALPILHRLGFPALVMTYRNDAGAPSSRGGRYHLGDAEWSDVEAGLLVAAERGAAEVVLFGWSMGGAIVLQVVARSWAADRVRAVVLDAPVLDWQHVLDHHTRLQGLPGPVGRLAQGVLQHRAARRLLGVDAPLALDRLDWVTRAAELRVPLLILHSDDDEFVPAEPSRRLASARPDVVTYVPTRGARHTKEWNVDSDAWDSAVARFLLEL